MKIALIDQRDRSVRIAQRPGACQAAESGTEYDDARQCGIATLFAPFLRIPDIRNVGLIDGFMQARVRILTY